MIYDVNYKTYLSQNLEKEIEMRLKSEFHKDFKIAISADTDIITDANLEDSEKKEIIKLVSAYLINFDSQFISSDKK